MWFPLPAAFEMNLTDGSSWPTYQPLSTNLDTLPTPFTEIGSVQRLIIVCFTDSYFGLQPLQSISPVAFGITSPRVAEESPDVVAPSVDFPASDVLQCSAFQ